MTLTLKRYVKLLVQIMFYGLTIMVIFAMCDYHTITIKMLVYTLLSPLMQINRSFVASFMAFYAFVPFYNKFIDFLSQKQFIVLIAGLLFVMTFCSSFFLAPTMNEPIWYMTLYFVAAYIRIYPNKYFYNLKLSSITLVVSIVLAIVVCLSFVHMASITGRHVFVLYKWHLVADSNKALAFIIGLSAFLTAKNLNIGHNRIINGLAAGCFGVLLIHASSDTMRKWLWQDVCNVPEMFNSDIISLVVQAIAVPIIVFLVCSFIDHFYKKYLEPAFMGMIFPEKKKSIQMTSNG